MDFTPVLYLGILVFCLIFLYVLAGKYTGLKNNQKKDLILQYLPGHDCKVCGFEDCENFARELLSNASEFEKCSIVDPHNVDKILGIIGKEPLPAEQKMAVISCVGGKQCTDKYDYSGVQTCDAVSRIFRGEKNCIYGCLGFGDCARACPFDAITQNIGEVPVVNKNKCTGCGKCTDKCPKKIISLIPKKYDVHIRCSSFNSGRFVRGICLTGCISCGICVKICPTKAIEIKDNLAVIDYEKCTTCGLCIDKCPQNTIERILPSV
ncbi:MAG: hypothetical protein A2252_07275 [Elusimicrobia bacterium RIFOXYA2_FULL_39_19]|nr:MAG: hypothetical protein A2252_07275 [Elusimicrobia bacterium RIFOXYA2_FULL_39_19]